MKKEDLKSITLCIIKSRIKDEFLSSNTYKKVMEHRGNCPFWKDRNKGKCFDCFGGGLTKFTTKLLTEEKFVKEIKRHLDKVIE